MQKFTYCNVFTGTEVTIPAQDSHRAWIKLCDRISASEQINFVLKTRKLEGRKIDTCIVPMYLKNKENKKRTKVGIEMLHHKQRMCIGVFKHFKNMNKQQLVETESEKIERFERCQANTLYDTVSLN